MSIYHVLIDYDETSTPRIVILDREPAAVHNVGVLICGNVNVHTGLAIDIGRAIERKGNRQP